MICADFSSSALSPRRFCYVVKCALTANIRVYFYFLLVLHFCVTVLAKPASGYCLSFEFVGLI